ncbi:hypothetical protein BpHYR1_011481, partial [Brachionus plicatilis]
FSNNDISTHLNNIQANQNFVEPENCSLIDSKVSNGPKKISKETKKLNSVLYEQENSGYVESMKKILSNLALEFILDCKQRLDSENFFTLLSLLNKDSIGYRADLNSKDLKIFLYQIFDLIKTDSILCQKFSSFLTNEYAMEFNLVLEANQYEKTLDFLQKLELLIPNRSTFRKLLQSIISLGNFSSSMDTSISKMEYIKSKIRSLTKNNALVNIDLDHLFDQRFANVEPIYEKISLAEANLENFSTSTLVDQEFIDLTFKTSDSNKKNVKHFKNKHGKNSKKIN